MTIKQFGYIAFGSAVGVILYFLVPKVLFLNFLAAAVFILLGIAFAFVPINDRPMDIWLKNLFERLLSPTQYYYRKNNPPPKILLGLQLPPREVLLQHIKAQQSLNEYLQKKPKTDVRDNMTQVDENFAKRKQQLDSLLSGTISSSPASPVSPVAYTPLNIPGVSLEPAAKVASRPGSQLGLSGTVFTPNGIPLSNQMVYVKKGEETVRLFKTNEAGRFQNNLPLAEGEYLLEIVDPRKKHDFARMKINNQSTNLQIFAQK